MNSAKFLAFTSNLLLRWRRFKRFLYTIDNPFTICLRENATWYIYSIFIWMRRPQVSMSLTYLHGLTVFCFIISDVQEHIVQIIWNTRKNWKKNTASVNMSSKKKNKQSPSNQNHIDIIRCCFLLIFGLRDWGALEVWNSSGKKLGENISYQVNFALRQSWVVQR